jgi:hypothetical protein
MNKLYAVAISQNGQDIDLQIIETDSKVEALWQHDAVDLDDRGVKGSLFELIHEMHDEVPSVKYKDLRNFLAEHNILVTVTKICD